MSEPYEQMELDTRPKLQIAIEELSAQAVSDAGQLIQEHYRQAALDSMVAPPFVRNRHEAYGIAAEQLAKISGAVKSIKDDTASLLGTLSDPNLPALDATSSICNSTLEAATIIIHAAARMQRTLRDLYTAERTEPEHTPMDDLATGGEFEEAAPADAGEMGGDAPAQDE